jgi:Zn finger protein HypA/HybF involved in hydrogenase expression
MHELSYCEAVLEAVERRAQGRPVAHVSVRIGEVHRIVQGAFEQSFQLAAQGGPAEGATTEVVTVPGDEVLLAWIEYADAPLEQPTELIAEHHH